MAKEYRVAVASRSSEVVDQHFGKCTQFLIFNLLEDKVELLEKRDNVPACNTKDKREGTLLNTCNVISDCNFVIVKKIGMKLKNYWKKEI
jgi:nitrogen fixation protein NifB